MKIFKSDAPFLLEAGGTLTELEIAYQTYGQLNANQNNVVWICHALTGSADAADWWSGLVGEGKLFDPARYFIVCANMLGSCYGTTGPRSIDPSTGKPFGKDFPLVSVRDMVQAHRLLQKHLDIKHIRMIIGGSMGGQQAIEWAVSDPGLFDTACLLATNARHSPWGIAFNESQRMAIEADPTLHEDSPEAGKRGLEAARSIAMLSYRHYKTYHHTQSEGEEKLDGFRASTYQRYQGLKLFRRFDVFSYLSLSRSMDSHNVGRDRGGVENALQQVKAKTLVIGIETDVLFPVEEQELLVRHIPNAALKVIGSLYGHDGFLIESEAIAPLVKPLLEEGLLPERSDGKPAGKGLNGSFRINTRALPGTEEF